MMHDEAIANRRRGMEAARADPRRKTATDMAVIVAAYRRGWHTSRIALAAGEIGLKLGELDRDRSGIDERARLVGRRKHGSRDTGAVPRCHAGQRERSNLRHPSNGE